MVRIPVTEDFQKPQIAEMPNLAGDGFAAPGRALQGLGQGIASLGEAIGSTLGSEDNKKTEFDDNLKKLKFSNEVDASEIESQNTYSGDGTGYAAERAQWFQEKSDQLRASLSPRGQQTSPLYIEHKRGAFGRTTLLFEGHSKQQTRVNNTEEAVTTEFGKVVDGDPADFERNFDTARRSVDAIINKAPLPPHMKNALRDKAAATAEAVIEGIGADNPKAAIMALPRVKKIIEQFTGPTPSSDATGVQGLPGTPSGVAGEKPQGQLFPVPGITPDQVPRDGGLPNSREHMGPRGGGHHAGWDIPGQTGAPVVAVQDGTIIKAGTGQGYGSYIDVKYGDGTIHRMAHLGHADKEGSQQPFAKDWQSGDKVSAGTQLGYLGYSGNAGKDFVHVHYEIFPNQGAYDNAAGQSSRASANLRVNPREYFSGGQAATAQAQPAISLKGSIPANLSAYSPQQGGSKMEGGYAASKPGPDGKAEVRTLADYVAGSSPYVTLAGNPRDYGKTFIIPQISYVDADGKTQQLSNVKGVVHDTGSAFSSAPKGRFDIPIDKDASDSQMAANHTLWKKQGVRLVESNGTETGSVAPQQQAQVPAQAQTQTQRAPNTIPVAPTAPGAPVQVADASGQTVPRAPSAIPVQQAAPQATAGFDKGSVGNSLRERLIKKLPAYQRQFEGAVQGMLKDIDSAAEKGYVLPEQNMREAADAVRSSGNKDLAVQLEKSVATAQFVSAQRASRPEDLLAWAQSERSKALTSGATPDQIAHIDRAEKLANTIDENLKDTPVRWAVSTGVIPEQSPITAGHFNPDVLSQRAQTVAALSQYYGRDLPYFQKDERDAIKTIVSEGGDKAVQALGMMNDAFGLAMPRAMKDISKDAPEAASLGWLISQKASPQVIKDLAYGLKLKHSEDFKPMAPAQALARTTALGVLGTAFRALPASEDNAIALANLLYEVRARQKGVQPDAKGTIGDADLWMQGLKEVLGETKDPATGKTYGGIYSQGSILPSMFGGHYKQNIIVPANVRQDAMPDLINALKVGDLGYKMPQLPVNVTNAEQGAPGVAGKTGTPSGPAPVIGLPLDARGRPISLSDFRTANLVSIGDGKYALAMGDPNGDKPDWVITNGPNRDREGRFVLDIKALEPVLRQRVPGAYRPY